MRRFALHIIMLVLAALTANLFALSFGSEALADVIAYHRSHTSPRGVIVDFDANGVDHDNGSPAHTGATCNHSCHADSHLQGMIGDAVPPEAAVPVTCFPYVAIPAPQAASETQYRPPRASLPL